MCNREYLPALIASIFLGGPALGQTVGFVDDFSSPGAHGWSSKISNTNPETGGVGGVGDGYLKIEQADAPFNFGTHNDGANYAGNWTAAGITQVSFYLNDVNTDEDFSFHFLVTGDGANPNGESTWQYNTGFQPPNGSWQQYSVALTSDINWTRTRGNASLADVLADVADAQFRHDLTPFVTSPDPISGDIGIDNIALAPEPSTITLLASLGLLVVRRRRPLLRKP